MRSFERLILPCELAHQLRSRGEQTSKRSPQSTRRLVVADGTYTPRAACLAVSARPAIPYGSFCSAVPVLDQSQVKALHNYRQISANLESWLLTSHGSSQAHAPTRPPPPH